VTSLASLACAATVLAPAPPRAQGPPSFAAHVEAVFVDAFVTEKGVPVTGLAASDFELKDNGVRQDVELASVDATPLATVLVFDTSGSVAGERLAALKAAGRAFLDGLREGDEASLLTFSHELARPVPPTRDLEKVRRALEGIRAEGHTALMDAVYAGLMAPAGRERAMLVLFTDGEDNLSFLTEDEVFAVALESHVLVHAVGLAAAEPRAVTVAPAAARAQEPDHVRGLRRLTEATGGRYWEAASAARLGDAFAAILEAMKTRYILRYEPAGVARQGLHRLEVRLRKRDGDVQARRAYYVPRGR
jgi:VWFA-related protein